MSTVIKVDNKQAAAQHLEVLRGYAMRVLVKDELLSGPEAIGCKRTWASADPSSLRKEIWFPSSARDYSESPVYVAARHASAPGANQNPHVSIVEVALN